MYGISLNKSLNLLIVQEFSIVLFSPSVVSTSLWPHGLQHTRLPCPSSPTACSNSCMSIELVMAIQPLHPLPSPSPSTFYLFQHQGLFQWFGSLQQVAKVLEFQHQSFSEYSGQISFRMDWFDLLAVQGTLKSLLQHHSSKASILQCSAFFMVQLSHPYMTTGKTIALTILALCPSLKELA